MLAIHILEFLGIQAQANNKKKKEKMKDKILPCKGGGIDKGGNSGGGDDIRQHCREKLRCGIRLLFIIRNELRV